MISLRKIRAHKEPLEVDAVQDGNEVHLKSPKGHSFVIVKRDENGDAVVGINDVDTGVQEWHKISLLTWQR